MCFILDESVAKAQHVIESNPKYLEKMRFILKFTTEEDVILIPTNIDETIIRFNDIRVLMGIISIKTYGIYKAIPLPALDYHKTMIIRTVIQRLSVKILDTINETDRFEIHGSVGLGVVFSAFLYIL
jgi:hypothetical protein